jgi:hypothetical protein
MMHGRNNGKKLMASKLVHTRYLTVCVSLLQAGVLPHDARPQQFAVSTSRAI